MGFPKDSWNDDTKKGSITYKANRGGNVKEQEGRKYNGVMYRVGFRTNREIDFVGVGLFGPCEAEFGEYIVKLEVVRRVQDYLGIRKIFKVLGPHFREEQLANWTASIGQVPKGRIFPVVLPTPVKVKPYEWLDIKFEMEGETTVFLTEGYAGVDVGLKDGSSVKFEFLGGSCQLPEILFRVDD